MLKSILLTVVMTGLLAGCATTQMRYVADPAKSEAMNVIEAAHINSRHEIKDMDPGELRQKLGRDWSGAKDAAFTLNALAHGSWLFGITSLFMPGPYYPETYIQVVAWMPENEADNAESARKYYREILDKALEKTANNLPPPYHTYIYKKGGLSEYHIEGGGCSLKKKEMPYLLCLMATVQGEEEPAKVECPSFVGKGRCWRWATKHPMVHLWPALRVRREESTIGFKDVLLEDPSAFGAYLELSANLPKWVYIYLPPTGKVAMGKGKGFLRYPIVLNQGRILYFIKPERS